VSNSQYLLAKVLTGKYCELLTCGTIGTVVLRLECGCTKKFPKSSLINCPEIEDDLRRLWQNTFLRTFILAGKKCSEKNGSQKVPRIFADRKGVSIIYTHSSTYDTMSTGLFLIEALHINTLFYQWTIIDCSLQLSFIV